MLHLKDKAFGPPEAEQSELLIKAEGNRLSYAVLTAEKKVAVLFDSDLQMPFEDILSGLISENDYLRFPYKAVKLAIETFHFTFIPTELFSEENLLRYESLFSKTLIPSPRVSSSTKTGIKTVFNAPDHISRKVREHYPTVSIHPQSAPLIEGIFQNYQPGKRLVLQFNQSSFELLVLSHKGLEFYNIFELSTPDDFNYYLLLVLQQLNMGDFNSEVLLCGDIDSESLLFKRTEKYFSKISFASTVRINGMEGDFKNIEQHRFFSLLSLSLCE